MSAVIEDHPRAAAPPANEAEMRAALAWETGEQAPDDKSTWVWLWESIQGDFNDNRSTGQIAFDAAVSMLPLVDQICDVRDLIANCRAIAASDDKDDNTWKWVALALTLVGLIPTLGSLLKGMLKIMFAFVRRHGIEYLEKAIDLSMTWVIVFLRKPEVQARLRKLPADEVFEWLADGVRALQGEVNSKRLLANFDSGIDTMKHLLEKVSWVPKAGDRAKQALATVERIRAMAPQPLARVSAIVQRILGALARRFDMEHLLYRHGILNLNNVHFRGTLPQARAVTLLREKPGPAWLSEGKQGKFAPLRPADPDLMTMHRNAQAKGWCQLTDDNVRSFHKLRADEIVGPATLYRIISPSSGAMGDCWVSEEVFQKIMSSPDPKAAWRKHLGVWPDWNANGQFAVYDIPAGESLKVWRGEAASQAKKNFDSHLEGGWEQIVFKPTAANGARYDTMRVYEPQADGRLKPSSLSHDQYLGLSAEQREAYVTVREQINDPRIKGPFDTHWGTTDFDAQMDNVRIGLPALPGQLTNTAN